MIIRDHHGFVIAAQCKKIPIIQEPVMVEATAAREVVEFCRDVGIQDVIMEGDSLQVVQAFEDPGVNFRPFGQVVEEDAKSILGKLRSWKINHVKRDANMAAHTLAKFGLTCTMEHVWMEEIPECIFPIVTLEHSAPSC